MSYDTGHKEGYDEGYAAGHLAAKIQQLREGNELVRASILASMKEEYENKVQKAYANGQRAGERAGERAGYDKGYLDGKAAGFQEGAAAGRRERLETIMLPGEAATDAVARMQAREAGRQELASYLLPIIAQVKEGSPLAAAIAGRVEEAMNDFLKEKV